jgi:hypothetical protein
MLVLCLLLVTACSSFEQREFAGSIDSDDGAGGGIGGTGIIGVVTDLDGIIVNGRPIDVTEGTSIREDGETVTIDDVRIGKVVQITAVGPPTRLSSRSIDIRHEVVGPITKVDWASGVVTVLDQAVTFARGAIVDLDPKVGDKVSISGFRLSNRTIVATRIESVASTLPAQLYGRYQVVDNAVQIDGVVVQGVAPSPDLLGREVFAQGLLADGEFTPTRFEVQPATPFDGMQRDLSIAGFLDAQTKTLSETSVANVTDDVGLITLANGRSESFGIFEGRLSSDLSVLNVERQLSAPGIFDAPDRVDSENEDAGDSNEGSDRPTLEERDDPENGADDSTGVDNGGVDDDGSAVSDADTGTDNANSDQGLVGGAGNLFDSSFGIFDRTVDAIFGSRGIFGRGIGSIINLDNDRNGSDRDDRDESKAGGAEESANTEDGSAGNAGDSDAGDGSNSKGAGNDGNGSDGGTADSGDAGDVASDDKPSDRNAGGRGSLGDRVRDRIDNVRDGIGGILR